MTTGSLAIQVVAAAAAAAQLHCARGLAPNFDVFADIHMPTQR